MCRLALLMCPRRYRLCLKQTFVSFHSKQQPSSICDWLYRNPWYRIAPNRIHCHGLQLYTALTNYESNVLTIDIHLSRLEQDAVHIGMWELMRWRRLLFLSSLLSKKSSIVMDFFVFSSIILITDYLHSSSM